MSIKSIPLKTWEVQATLDNRKSTLRRVVKMDRPSIYKAACSAGRWSETFGGEIPDEVAEWYAKAVAKPPYRPGDILWVRETWSPVWAHPIRYLYKCFCPEADGLPVRWHPSIHMPREAARLFLWVKSVRVERLQDCGNAQAKDEGCTCCSQFVRLWDSTLQKKQNKFKCAEGAWSTNPWVWVVEFERCEKPENFLNGGRP